MGQGTEDRGQVTEDKSPMALTVISVGILKFFKTIVRPWQADVLKKEKNSTKIVKEEIYFQDKHTHTIEIRYIYNYLFFS